MPLDDYWIFWSHWYLANALPNLTLGPVFLIWFSDRARWTRWTPSRADIEPAVLGVLLICVCILAAAAGARLGGSSLLPAVLFLPLPFVLWAAIRFGEKGASGAILIVAVILTWRTLHGHGLFPDIDPERGVLALQMFLTGLSIPVLLLGALIDELRGAEHTTRALAASLVRAQDEERRRIARDLHDSTGQNLIAATLIAGRIEQVVPAAAQAAFRQLEEMLQQSIREVRTVSYLLHPPLLDEAGLVLALRSFVEGFVERSGVAVDLEVAEDVGRLAPDTELVLFRLVQEALSNVSRHSRSRTAAIRLAREQTAGGQNVVLTIEDAGIGMPQADGIWSLMNLAGTSRARHGVGLAGMRERLHQIGGRLEIDSAPGHTLLKAVVSIRDHAPV
jgi:signal transduction histidine kinase